MNRQELSFKITLIFVLITALLCAYIGNSLGHQSGRDSRAANIRVEKLRADVANLNFKEAQAENRRLREENNSLLASVDSFNQVLDYSKEQTLLTRDSLGRSLSQVSRMEATIDSALFVIDSLHSLTISQDSSIERLDILIASVRKGKDLLVHRLNNAAATEIALRDTVDLLLPDAITTNKLRQENYLYRFGFFFLLLVLSIIIYGVKKGWFVKPKKVNHCANAEINRPQASRLKPGLDLSPELFRRQERGHADASILEVEKEEFLEEGVENYQ